MSISKICNDGPSYRVGEAPRATPYGLALLPQHLSLGNVPGISVCFMLRDVFVKSYPEKMLWQSKEYSQDAPRSRPQFFGGSLIGLYTGMRLEEICQGTSQKSKEIDGVWCFDVNDDKPDKSVKTEDRRLVPSHPFLVKDLGFIKYVQSLPKDGRIFPTLKGLTTGTATTWADGSPTLKREVVLRQNRERRPSIRSGTPSPTSLNRTVLLSR